MSIHIFIQPAKRGGGTTLSKTFYEHALGAKTHQMGCLAVCHLCLHTTKFTRNNEMRLKNGKATQLLEQLES